MGRQACYTRKHVSFSHVTACIKTSPPHRFRQHRSPPGLSAQQGMVRYRSEWLS